MNFFAELKRRHMYRVAAAYAVVAWVLLQLVNNLAPGLNLPNWATTLVIVLLAVGFPIALLFCWIQHMPSADGEAQQAKTTRLDWILAGGLVAVIAIFLFQEFAQNDGATTQRPSGVEAARTAAASPAGISIAVLPFANVSADADQEFFSDGMTDEISGTLAKIPDLRVVGRASAFQYKKRDNDLRAIGQALGATHLIEGSVRKVGNRVRITAQLVQADNGLQMWTENYDRELTDVFAIQEEIARAIAVSLRMPLGLKPGENLVSNRSLDPDSYEQYLRAKALVRGRTELKSLTDAAALLEQVVARHSDYAPAWATLALTYDLTPQSSPPWLSGSAEELRAVVTATQTKAEAAAQRAIRLDPNLAGGYTSLALVQQRRGKLVAAEEAFLKALALDPNNTDLLQAYGNFLIVVGRLKEALESKQRLHAIEPLAPVFTATTSIALWLNGQDSAAEAMTKELPPTFRASTLAPIYAGQGRYADAADALGDTPPDMYPPEAFQTALRLLRDGPSLSIGTQSLPPMVFLEFIYLRAGTPERTLEQPERNTAAGYFQAINTGILWHPSYAPVRKLERFKAYLRKAGLVDYWRAKGWPELCHPTTGDDFACD